MIHNASQLSKTGIKNIKRSKIQGKNNQRNRDILCVCVCLRDTDDIKKTKLSEHTKHHCIEIYKTTARNAKK